jgi:hypothetical protein
MPSIEQHMGISKARTGLTYEEIHNWIDDPSHKDDRHKITKIPENFETLRSAFGEEAAREYIQHLNDDLIARFRNIEEELRLSIEKNISYFCSVEH